jgi:C4-dicarboxylate transporter, DctM subunit
MLATSLLLLFGLILLSLSIASVLGILGLAMGHIFTPMPLYRGLADVLWLNAIEFLLIAIPLFIFMGEILLRSGVATSMYDALTKWLGWLPGGLMHTNIGSSAMFAATSGSSVATAATISTVALPEVEARGYNERLFLGSLTSGGTLGILIPPSINLIIYGLLTSTSVSSLYLAGLIPGLVLALIFSATIFVACLIRPDWGGTRIHSSWAVRMAALPNLLSPLLIFLIVVGSIYAGLATPTEAAALGVVGAMALAASRGRLSVAVILASVEATMRTTALVMLIVLAAMFLNFVLGFIGLTQALAAFVADLGWSPVQTLLAIVVFFIVLGCFLETLSMLITTAPLIVPIVVGLGYDPIWFGILLMVLLEMALLTPPIGINLYVVQSVRRRGTLTDVVIGTLPFLGSMLIMVFLLILFPEIALWLPRVAGG